MIERLDPGRAAFLPGEPNILAKERALAPCGCFVAVGIRLDLNEVATAASPCSKHKAEMTLFNDALRETLDDPEDRPLVEVCDEILAMVLA